MPRRPKLFTSLTTHVYRTYSSGSFQTFVTPDISASLFLSISSTPQFGLLDCCIFVLSIESSIRYSPGLEQTKSDLSLRVAQMAGLEIMLNGHKTGTVTRAGNRSFDRRDGIRSRGRRKDSRGAGSVAREDEESTWSSYIIDGKRRNPALCCSI